MSPYYREIIMPARPELRTERGWSGVFTRQQEPGAMPNGTRIEKCNAKPGDGNPNGAPGTVLGSFDPEGGKGFVYFVEWDGSPRVAVCVAPHRIREQSDA